MFCNGCKYKAYSGGYAVCGWYLHGGETVYIKKNVKEWCPLTKQKNNNKIETACGRP